MLERRFHFQPLSPPARLSGLCVRVNFLPIAVPQSHIIFTNGMNDGWSAGSIVANLSETLIAINMPNGAHHSDLSHDLPGPQDTPDITAGRAQAAGLLSGWLAEIKAVGAAQ